MADMGDFRPRYAPPGMMNTQNIEGGQNVPMSREELMALISALPVPSGPTVVGGMLGAGAARLGGKLGAGAAYHEAPLAMRAGMMGAGGAYGAGSVALSGGPQSMDAEGQPGGFYGQDPRLLARELMK